MAILDRLGPAGIVITKNGTPVATLHPIKSGCASFVGCMKGKSKIKGDVFSTE
jgi:antitoxin (DNA-binding transcriptional repressor) of toxin-antitoxin stability system